MNQGLDRREFIKGVGVAVLTVQCLPLTAHASGNSPSEGNEAADNLIIHSGPGLMAHVHELLIPYAILNAPPLQGVEARDNQSSVSHAQVSPDAGTAHTREPGRNGHRKGEQPHLCDRDARQAKGEVMSDRNETVNVRYMVDDVEKAVAFYTNFLDFKVLTSFAPAFADVARGNLRLLLSGPTSSAGRPMPDGAKPGPGGWNRIHSGVDDIEAEVTRLRDAGARVPQRHPPGARAASRSCSKTLPATSSNSSNPPQWRRHEMAKQTIPTRVLLACGVVAGPLYVIVTMAQALTRDGFDLKQHRFNAADDRGSRLAPPGEHAAGRSADGAARGRSAPNGADGPRRGVGAAAARAVRSGVHRRRSAPSGPGGRLPAGHDGRDGAEDLARSRPERLTRSQHAPAHCDERGVRGIARRRGAPALGPGSTAPRSPWCSLSWRPSARPSASTPSLRPFSPTPWVWVTMLAVYLYRREAKQRHDVPAGQGTRSTPAIA